MQMSRWCSWWYFAVILIGVFLEFPLGVSERHPRRRNHNKQGSPDHQLEETSSSSHIPVASSSAAAQTRPRNRNKPRSQKSKSSENQGLSSSSSQAPVASSASAAHASAAHAGKRVERETSVATSSSASDALPSAASSLPSPLERVGSSKLLVIGAFGYPEEDARFSELDSNWIPVGRPNSNDFDSTALFRPSVLSKNWSPEFWQQLPSMLGDHKFPMILMDWSTLTLAAYDDKRFESGRWNSYYMYDFLDHVLPLATADGMFYVHASNKDDQQLALKLRLHDFIPTGKSIKLPRDVGSAMDEQRTYYIWSRGTSDDEPFFKNHNYEP
eukprot:TRINITY_DN65878_c0_g1_i1.p1 TRINITY_DN65878_c0_g1~~TRINITY_DN65878_c0_g1_i1.p1  ORF type:complete len:328 (-),score=30.60 TRINITY_DN65878_c0_g1_i1:55-1038(-)